MTNITASRITPEHITSLQPDEIFVFGSNIKGQHAAGAARMALRWGAVIGEGIGIHGQTYAIPTMSGSVAAIAPYVNEFIAFARLHPQLKFWVTEIGCGIAGYSPLQIAPLFVNAIEIENVALPIRFWEVIDCK